MLGLTRYYSYNCTVGQFNWTLSGNVGSCFMSLDGFGRAVVDE